MSQPQAVPAPPTPVENPSVWEDFIDVFYSPATVFRRRENGSFLIPLLVVSVLTAVIVFTTFDALRSLVEADVDRQLALMAQRDARMTPELLERSRSMMIGLGKWGSVVGLPLIMLAVGAVAWLCGKFFGSRQSLHAAFVVTMYAYMPRVVGGIVAGAQALLLDTSRMTSFQALAIGPARFLDPGTTSALTMAFAMRLDLFTVWVTVLIGIGLYVTGRMSKVGAAAAATLVWVLGSMPAIVGGLRAG